MKTEDTIVLLVDLSLHASHTVASVDTASSCTSRKLPPTMRNNAYVRSTTFADNTSPFVKSSEFSPLLPERLQQSIVDPYGMGSRDVAPAVE